MRNLNKILKEKGRTKQWLADQLGLTTQTLNNYKRGDIEPKLWVKKLTAEFLEVELKDLE